MSPSAWVVEDLSSHLESRWLLKVLLRGFPLYTEWMKPGLLCFREVGICATRGTMATIQCERAETP